MKNKLLLTGKRSLFWLITPGWGLFISWFIVWVISANISNLLGSAVLFGSFALLLALMFSIGAYIPPAKPLKEISALGARISELLKVVSGAALFGSAAAYGGIVSLSLSKMSEKQAISVETTWGIIEPIVTASFLLGATIVGTRLGWDLLRTPWQVQQDSLHRLKVRLFPDGNQGVFLSWVSRLVLLCGRRGIFMIVGFCAPVVIYLGLLFLLENYPPMQEFSNIFTR
ncbi:hypothetical protein AOZ07_01590 [Glutamicibacter halophytocola]|uniref:hypothetical protein n=1 Tax=Glutamicibacter halophytocola TaxID=1933880 RepID=UPI0006D4AE86|nr:hypothetical protein [Glutamicibacter halophytocola]ALG27819.1 hypothetical protein AOZ07_01590 [Glutamicibacter halophytocola]